MDRGPVVEPISGPCLNGCCHGSHESASAYPARLLPRRARSAGSPRLGDPLFGVEQYQGASRRGNWAVPRGEGSRSRSGCVPASGGLSVQVRTVFPTRRRGRGIGLNIGVTELVVVGPLPPIRGLSMPGMLRRRALAARSGRTTDLAHQLPVSGSASVRHRSGWSSTQRRASRRPSSEAAAKKSGSNIR